MKSGISRPWPRRSLPLRLQASAVTSFLSCVPQSLKMACSVHSIQKILKGPLRHNITPPPRPLKQCPLCQERKYVWEGKKKKRDLSGGNMAVNRKARSPDSHLFDFLSNFHLLYKQSDQPWNRAMKWSDKKHFFSMPCSAYVLHYIFVSVLSISLLERYNKKKERRKKKHMMKPQEKEIPTKGMKNSVSIWHWCS